MAPRALDERAVARFEESVLPQLGAAYNLARWLTRNEHDAQDVAQEALLRAFKAFQGFRGTDARTWLLAIVRNTCYTWLRRSRAQEVTTPFDEELHTPDGDVMNPERLVLKDADTTRVRQALEDLPVEFREVLVLREIEGLSYKEIATIADIPVGTVMSRLARARGRLQHGLAGPPAGEGSR
jgi:RNA polymerase sigma factor (sigma-70 family)